MLKSLGSQRTLLLCNVNTIKIPLHVEERITLDFYSRVLSSWEAQVVLFFCKIHYKFITSDIADNVSKKSTELLDSSDAEGTLLQILSQQLRQVQTEIAHVSRTPKYRSL